MIDVGRICVKTAGREAGKFCVVVDVLEDRFVMVSGPRAVTNVKRRKCNIDHLEPTPEVIKIKKNASDDEIIGAYKHEGIFKKLGKEPPSAKDIEHAKEAERKRAVAKKEKPKAEEKKEEKKPEKPPEPEKKPEKKEHKEKKEKPKEKHKEHKKPEKKPKHKPEKAKKKAKPKKK